MERPRHNRLTEADRAVWANYASRVSPLPGRERAATTARLEPAAALLTRPRPLAAARVGHAPQPPLAIGSQPGGVDSSTWHRFRTGKLEAARTLDLHGFTAQRAFLALASFVRASQAERLRCIEVVTGQGGVLRRELPLWLNLPELRGLVLAAAHPHAANPGSVRLLLRRAR
jgi:DNA-nicking Smr family endonuclease